MTPLLVSPALGTVTMTAQSQEHPAEGSRRMQLLFSRRQDVEELFSRLEMRGIRENFSSQQLDGLRAGESTRNPEAINRSNEPRNEQWRTGQNRWWSLNKNKGTGI